jgi:hypothetical protein
MVLVSGHTLVLASPFDSIPNQKKTLKGHSSGTCDLFTLHDLQFCRSTGTKTDSSAARGVRHALQTSPTR